MSRRARRRRRARTTIPAELSTPVPDSVPPIGVGTVLTLVLVVLIGATAVRMTVAEDFRDATVSAACGITGCSGSGMALTGWLLALTPLLYGLAIAKWFRRAPVAWIVAGGLLFIAAIQFAPGRRGPELEELLNGPGSAALAGGLLWGAGTSAAVLVILIALRTYSGRGSAVFLAFLAGGTIAATTARDEPGYLLTTQIFPELTVRVQDDVLTRTSATDLDGCGGRYPGCLRTAEFEFTTDDSDAVVVYQVISFPDNDRAWDAWGDSREKTGDPAILRVNEVTGEWLTVATVRHADGRAIAAGEEKWLRWPAAQLDYAFRRAIDYSLLHPPTVSETVGPRTP